MFWFSLGATKIHQDVFKKTVVATICLKIKSKFYWATSFKKLRWFYVSR